MYVETVCDRHTLVYPHVHTCFSDSSKSVASYKSMYAVALRGSQPTSGTVSEQIERARDCLRTVASTRGDQ